jgi:two-component system chemotaxis response regulator CheY
MKTGIIVDDAAIMRLRLREILEPDFSVVGEAGNGDEAVRLCGELTPDFITLDISMPQTNGIEALKQIQENYPEVRVIMVSAVGQKRLVIDALQYGAVDFVIKPFDSDRVLQSVHRAFS